MKRRGYILAGSLALAACSGNEGPNISGVDGSQILTLQIQPAADTIFIPDSVRATDRLQLTATAKGQGGRDLTISRYVWSTSDSTVAVVDGSGLVTPVSAGTAVISASASRIATATVVVAPITNRVLLAPEADTLFVDDPISAKDSLRFVAAAFDASGARIAGMRFTWSTSSGTSATVDSTGLVKAVSLGTTALTVRSVGSQTVGSITVLPVLKSVVITDPLSAQALAGDSITLVASARNYGDTLVARRFTWASLTPGVATVDSTGRVAFLTSGSASITATSAFRSDTVTFTVESRALASVTVGGDFACGVGQSGRAWCWGKGTLGQLGSAGDSTCFDDVPQSGRLACALAPKALSRPELVFAQIAAGDVSACGVSTQQQLYCWGDDTFGQIGNGSGGGGSSPRLATVGSERFTTITAGNAHACALNVSGQAYCWGQDSLGQLGYNRGVNSSTPVPVSGPAGAQPSTLRFTAISAGGSHTCAVETTGALWCWGSNLTGALGDTAVAVRSLSPVAVRSTATYTQVAAGRNHTCALTTAGEIHCWGLNISRQVGVAAPNTVLLPTLIGSGYVAVVVGYDHTCGLLSGGAAQCWGQNEYGQLGSGDPIPSGTSATPVPVSGGLTFSRIAAGRRSTCGIDTAGVTWCWGSNHLGALGNQLQAMENSIPQRLAPLR